MSTLRTLRWSATAIPRSTESPTVWPWASLTCLKVSRSIIRTVSSSPKRRLRDSSCSSREKRWRRLGIPVSGSVNDISRVCWYSRALAIARPACAEIASASRISWGENPFTAGRFRFITPTMRPFARRGTQRNEPLVFRSPL